MLNKSHNDILYIHDYYPQKYKEHKGISIEILNFKNGDIKAVERFGKELKKEIESLLSLYRDETKFSNIVMTIMPSHSANRWGTSLEQVSHLLAKGFGMTDDTRLLIRHTDHEKLTQGGDRSVESHLKTVKIDPHYCIKGKTVIVLDDVTTSGNSLKAATTILTQNGARKVYPIAIAQTKSGTEKWIAFES